MGQILKVKCTSCAYETELFVGGGRQDCNLDVILSAVAEEKRASVEDALAQGAVGLSVARLPVACAACGTIYTTPVVSYTLHGKQVELRGVCPECGAQEEKASLSCPQCGAEVTRQKIGHWD